MSDVNARDWLYRVLQVPDVLTTDEAKAKCAAGAVRRIGGLRGAELGGNGGSKAEGLSKSVVDQLVNTLANGELDSHIGGYVKEHDKTIYKIADAALESARIYGVETQGVEDAVGKVVQTIVAYAQEHPVTWPKL